MSKIEKARLAKIEMEKKLAAAALRLDGNKYRTYKQGEEYDEMYAPVRYMDDMKLLAEFAVAILKARAAKAAKKKPKEPTV